MYNPLINVHFYKKNISKLCVYIFKLKTYSIIEGLHNYTKVIIYPHIL